MGCGSSNAFNNELSIPENKDKKEENEKKEKEKENEVINNKSETINPPPNLILSDNLSNIYVDYQFNFNPTDQNLPNNNILLYTSKYNPNGNSFILCDKSKHYETIMTEFRETPNKLSLYYSKGSKSSIFINQDKFFLLIDGIFQIYCLIDGHGPFGDIIAQIIQDKIFQYENDYDSILSGVSITIIINQDKKLYCSNIGNVTAFLFHVDKKNPSLQGIDILTIDDSDLQNSKNHLNTYYDMYNIHGNYDIIEERRRIYENGGEIRTIAEEPKQRIFVKGQYYPGVINTRSIGDRIANCIGVISKPHISERDLDSKCINYLVMYSDGIGISIDPEDIVNIIRGRVDNPHSSIYSVVEQAHNFFADVNYLPDMTFIMKVLE